MYMLINALLIALLALPLGADRKAEDGPACRAELNGSQLTTRVDLLNGISVEGPWHVIHRDDGVMYAQLDHVLEKDALTGERALVRLPHPIRLAFEGDTQSGLMRSAARTWCITVMRAQQGRTTHGAPGGQGSRAWIAEA